MVDREPLKGEPNCAHKPGDRFCNAARALGCHLSTLRALLYPLERLKLALQLPAYGKCLSRWPRL